MSSTARVSKRTRGRTKSNAPTRRSGLYLRDAPMRFDASFADAVRFAAVFFATVFFAVDFFAAVFFAAVFFAAVFFAADFFAADFFAAVLFAAVFFAAVFFAAVFLEAVLFDARVLMATGIAAAVVVDDKALGAIAAGLDGAIGADENGAACRPDAGRLLRAGSVGPGAVTSGCSASVGSVSTPPPNSARKVRKSPRLACRGTSLPWARASCSSRARRAS